jgi:hypothetical protein
MQGALLSLVSTSLFALSALAAAPYCLPGQACFPSTKAIATFNGTVGGKLFAPVPYAAVCYVDTYNAARCADLVANQTLDHYRDEIPTAAQFVNWELDDAGNGCVTPATVPPPPGITDRTCVLGAQASYVVRAETAQDVSLAVKFAAKYNLRLRVKNVRSARLQRRNRQKLIHDHNRRDTITLDDLLALDRSRFGRTT